MAWWFVVNGQQTGPAEDAELSACIADGRVSGHTLVWREGMGNWQPLGMLATGAPGSAGAAEASALLGGQAFCCQCARAFGEEDLIAYAGYKVCASCKPAFFQRVNEGALRPAAEVGGMQFGGFWLRFAAKLVDGLILGVVNQILFVPLFVVAFSEGMEAGRSGGAPPDIFHGMLLVVWALTVVAQLGVQAAYNTIFVGKYQSTPGKMVCGLKVVLSDGSKVSYMRAFGRFWAEMVSGLTLYIGYIIAAGDDEKRALHDHMCNTRVVKK